jgi:uncharacterized membrane protein
VRVSPRPRPSPALVRLAWTATLVLVLIGIAIVSRRSLNLLGFVRAGAVDGAFASNGALTFAHILPGLIYLVLGPFQFVRTLRARRPKLHRVMGRVTLVAAVATGVTALAMTSRMAIGGVVERAATVTFAVLFLFALGRAFAAIRRGDVAVHREWMIRAFAIGLAVATVRPIVGAFFATRALTHLTPPDFFGIAFWLGFLLHAGAAEWWIRATRAPCAPLQALSPGPGIRS